MALAASSSRAGGVSARVRPAPSGSRHVVVVRAAAVQNRADVQPLTASEAGSLLKEGWTVLDVRPPSEVSRVGIEGAKVAAMYIPETRTDPVNMIKRFATWSNGGWWVGGEHMIPNPTWPDEVKAKVPKDARLILACQNGMRSLAAVKQLEKLGYSGPFAWIKGGLDEARVGDLPTVPPGKDPRYGGVAGMSEALGWTKVQQENGDSAFAGGVNNILKWVAIVLALDLLSILVGYIDVVINGPKV